MCPPKVLEGAATVLHRVKIVLQGKISVQQFHDLLIISIHNTAEISRCHAAVGILVFEAELIDFADTSLLDILVWEKS